MGSWLASLQLESHEALGGRGVWPMCYGGAFAASRDGVRQLPRRDWLLIAKALSRGDNIAEGHYMERFWAAALGRPFPADLEGDLLCNAGGGPPRRAIVRVKFGPDASEAQTTIPTPYVGLIWSGTLSSRGMRRAEKALKR
mmetsp:Transcript_2528/g.7783  ORF Transcript_2528/g.7783 Transcript_2528/m.7783 type:complete len:141 (+) Transcript_2528:368-790(+)